MQTLSCILTIAGSDSGGGAGIQADLKTISMLGAYGASVITALTAQNTCMVAGIHAPPPEFVSLQLQTVLEDFEVAAAKTGMLFSAPIIRRVAEGLREKTFPLVVDPVCVAQSGAPLMEKDAVQAMAEHIFPLADLLTPNIPEAELFTGMTVSNREDMAKVAARLLEMGPRAVLLKGGHALTASATDWLALPGAAPIPLMQPRVETENNHGTGCTLSAAIAAGLGQGMEIVSAVRRAQQYLNLALRSSFSLGRCSGPPNHLAPLQREAARVPLLERLAESGRRLAALPGLAGLIPQVRSNVAMALPYADAPGDVAAFSGRITATRRGEVLIAGAPEFGASLHMARGLLAVRRVNPTMTCGMNVRLGKDVLAALEALGVVAAKVEKLPGGTGRAVLESDPFDPLVLDAVRRHTAPETVAAVYDSGGDGIEPMLRLFTVGPDELEALVGRLLRTLGSGKGEG